MQPPLNPPLADSWGSSVAVYDEAAASLDKFLFGHPEFLSVFAAGNYGTNSDLPTTVTSPATAKNCLSVGATMSWRRQYSRRLAAPVSNVRVEIMNAPDAPIDSDTLVLNWRVVGAAWGPSLETVSGRRLQLATASDGGAACTPGSGDAARGGVLVALRSAGCSLAAKIQVAHASGAVALLLATRSESGYTILQREDAAELLPVASIPLTMAQQLQAYADAGASTTVYVTFSRHDVCDCPSFEDIASYSSFGPTTDRRIKPDIVAPGDLTSAYSDGKTDGAVDTCRTQRKQGTSMATPVVAGSAALVRQYFTAGFYPSGAKVAANAFTPSGVLLKAVMVGGASDMIGYTEVRGVEVGGPWGLGYESWVGCLKATCFFLPLSSDCWSLLSHNSTRLSLPR
jgi:subtilisin family serine protease